jgi:arylsulfatase A-like enzyme
MPRGLPSPALGLLLCLCLACTRSDPAREVAHALDGGVQPDIVLVLINGLRADPPGQEGPEALLLDTIGLEPWARFGAAYTASSAKQVALGSVLTGRHPSAIPLCGTPRLDGDRELPVCSRIPAEVPTLPEVLGHYGYSSALFAAEGDSYDLVARGFGAVERSGTGRSPEQSWSWLQQRSLPWWSLHASSPRLLVLSTWIDDESFVEQLTHAQQQLAPSPAEKDAWRASHEPWMVDRVAGLDAWPIASQAGRAHVEQRYRAAVEAHGQGLGAVLAQLEPAAGEPRDRPLWVVISSLHGTLGRESGSTTPDQIWPGNFRLMLDRCIRVPLVLLRPGLEARPLAADHPVETLDLLPTFAQLAGAVPPAGMAGASLLEELKSPPEDAWAYSEYGDMLALRQGPWLMRFRYQKHGVTSLDPFLTEQLLERPPPAAGQPAQDHGTYLLHNVAEDPWQERDLSLERAELLRSMWQSMVRVRTEIATPPPELFQDETMQAIMGERAMHYW